MASAIPPEIWVMIAGLLPDNVLQKLRTLNSAFFQTAMDARYREVNLLRNILDGFRIAKMLQELERLSQPHIARRVRRVIIDLAYLDVYFTRHDHRVLIATYDPLDLTVLPSPIKIYSSDPLQQLSLALNDTLTSFYGVTDCYLRWHKDTPHSNSVRVMAYLWPSLSSGLLSINWELPPSGLHLLLQPTSTHFPALETLNIQMDLLLRTTLADEDEIYISVATFLNSHSPSLRSLSLSLSSHIHNAVLMDISHLFRELGHFPKLQQLSFDVGITLRYTYLSVPRAITRFLKDHANTLQSLTVKILSLDHQTTTPAPELRVSRVFPALFAVSLSHLISLNIAFYHTPVAADWTNAVLDIVPFFSDTLTSLNLDAFGDSTPLTYKQVETVALVFSRSTLESRLKTLSLTISNLAPGLVDFLAFTLPGLVTLTLNVLHPNYGFEGGDGSSSFNAEKRFHAAMQKRFYDGWGPCDLCVRTCPSLRWRTMLTTLTAKRIPDLQRPRSEP